MATTNTWLTTENEARICFVLAFEGYDLAFTTHNTPSELATAWSATDWTTFKSGLHIIGETGQEITIFDPKVNPDNLTFRCLDDGNVLSGRLLREADSSINKTYLTASLTANATSCTVKDTTGFSSAGHIYIGHEAIQYGVKGAGSFGALTRGKWVLWGRSGASTRYGMAHVIPTGTADINNSPAVTSLPRTWYNRRVGLYAHHLEDTQGTVWSTKANSQLIWAGRIKSYADNGDGTFSISCTHLLELLQFGVPVNQYRAELSDGLYIQDEDIAITFKRNDGAASTYAVTTTLTSSVNLTRTWQEVREEINSIFQAGFATTSTDSWQLNEVQTTSGKRVEIRVDGSISAFHTRTIGLSQRVWELLGFIPFAGGVQREDSTGRLYVEQALPSINPMKYIAPQAPLINTNYFKGNDKVVVTNERGVFETQPTMIPWVTGEGYVVVGSETWVIDDYDSATKTLTFAWPGSGGYFFIDPAGRSWSDLHGSISGDTWGGDRPQLTQAWIEYLPAGTTLLRLLLSTGVDGYNESTYDKYGEGYGLAIPYDLINVPSFEALDAEIPQYLLYIVKPTPVSEIVEQICAVTGRQIIFKDGKISLLRVGNMTYDQSANVKSLTENNKAKPDDRAIVSRTPEGIINSMVLKYFKPPEGVHKGEYQRTIQVEDLPSITDFGQRRAIEIKGDGIFKHDAWVDNVASPALANFSRPLAIIERTYDFSLYDLTPGDAVEVTDNYAIDPVAGTRGITALPCWVLATSFDWKTGTGKAKLVFSPEIDATRRATWSPSARIVVYTVPRTITCDANIFSHSSESADASHFEAGDKIRIVEISPQSGASPETYVGEVESVSGNDITLTSDVTGGAGLGAGKTFVIEPDDILTVQAAQKNHAFIADDSDNSTGNASNDAYRYGIDTTADTLSTSAITYNSEFVRPYNIADDKGEPMSIHKQKYLIDSLNNLYGYKTNNIILQDYVNRTDTNTNYTLAYGPVFVPIYGHPSRTYKVRLLGKIDNAANTVYYRVRFSSAPVRGSSYTSLTFPTDTTSIELTLTGSTDPQWTTETTITPVVQGTRPPHSYLTIEMKDDGSTGYLYIVSISESALS